MYNHECKDIGAQSNTAFSSCLAFATLRNVTEMWQNRQKNIVNVSSDVASCLSLCVFRQPRVIARPGSLENCINEAERRGAAGGSRPKLSAWPWTTRRGTEPVATTTRSTPIFTSSSATAGRRPLTKRIRSRTWNSRVSGKVLLLRGRKVSSTFLSFSSKLFPLFNTQRLRNTRACVEKVRIRTLRERAMNYVVFVKLRRLKYLFL